MLTVEADAAGVETRLLVGEIICPGCELGLRPWGWARRRVIRGLAGQQVMRPRRGQCPACWETHVLLPVTALLRRADAAVVIGAALAVKAAGTGHRRIAGWLDRPSPTVRGWLRAFARAAEAIRAYFAVALVGLAADPVLPRTGGDMTADAVAVIAEVADAAGRGTHQIFGASTCGFAWSRPVLRWSRAVWSDEDACGLRRARGCASRSATCPEAPSWPTSLPPWPSRPRRCTTERLLLGTNSPEAAATGPYRGCSGTAD
ncbi:hypothetical protein SAMN05444920_12691 [Nonomuraea solani]|uniref:Uncharacterized protein n=1 Tax=Nonomuraea solani TaxID=1144553 RepID=A0A1H6EYD9_9ACTN|nr:hypothetical protein SAMN05444920_12691 [Nonomuraea solani]